MHIQLVRRDLFAAHAQCLTFLLLVFGVTGQIILGGTAQNGAQGLHHVLFGDLAVEQHDVADLGPARGVHDRGLANAELELTGGKEIDLARMAEAHAHNLNGLAVGRGEAARNILGEIGGSGNIHGEFIGIHRGCLGLLFFFERSEGRERGGVEFLIQLALQRIAQFWCTFFVLAALVVAAAVMVILLMAVVVGSIVIALFLPLIQIIQTLTGG